MKSKKRESGGGAGGVATDLQPRGRADGKSERRVLYEGLEGSSAIYAKQHTAP